MKRNQKFAMGNQPMLIEAPGYLGVLLVPVDANGSVDVTLKPLQSANHPSYARFIDDRIEEVLEKINVVQLKMANHQYQEALSSLEQLETKFPTLTSLKILRANCLVLLGQNSQARAILEVVNREAPDNRAIAELYLSIGGDLKNLARAPASTPKETAR